MRSKFIVAVFIGFVLISALNADQTANGAEDETIPAPASALEAENLPEATLAVLTDEELKKLLGYRLGGEMGGTLAQFANMFMVTSRLRIGTGVGLMTESSRISKSELQSPFPESYHPTLRELLDAIALQTFSDWKYETTSKYFKSDVKEPSPVKGVAIFEFSKTKRKKPFKISLAQGWKANDKGNWVMYVPPQFPVGMDIYEMGTYSTKDKAGETEFLERIRTDVALEWANRVNPKAIKADLKPAKAGQNEALFYETLLKGQNKKEFRWRHWVFMVGNRCYFIVSTIPPDLDGEILPDVEKMVESFTAID